MTINIELYALTDAEDSDPDPIFTATGSSVDAVVTAAENALPGIEWILDDEGSWTDDAIEVWKDGTQIAVAYVTNL